ncbi:hypothetical protein [Chthonobacter rhizosphaerae]|uniref:hypothetical protein n=1 Tax=Chthonobacter rhizosphaerae TaxID=2735553 RepID=UPI0015EED225|nr:hypothetical protein [Chthonobacter rhizosphaerae]
MVPDSLRLCRIFLVSSAGPTSPEIRRALAAAGLFHAVPAPPTAQLPDHFTPRRVNMVVAPVDDAADRDALAWVRRIRHHRDPNVALAPLVAVGRSIRPSGLALLVHHGFDDVVVLPADPQTLVDRLTRTVVAPEPFYRTADYFGPDRRRAFAVTAVEERRGTPAGPASRLTVARQPGSGCSIVDEVAV